LINGKRIMCLTICLSVLGKFVFSICWLILTSVSMGYLLSAVLYNIRHGVHISKSSDVFVHTFNIYNVLLIFSAIKRHTRCTLKASVLYVCMSEMRLKSHLSSLSIKAVGKGICFICTVVIISVRLMQLTKPQYTYIHT